MSIQTGFLSQVATRVIEERFSVIVAGVTRFSTGLSHFVFDVTTTSGDSYVVRITSPARKGELDTGLYWHRILVKIDVPLSKLYQTDVVDNRPFAIYERLPGADLEEVYPTLTSTAKRNIAHTVADIQQRVHQLDKRYLLEPPSDWRDILETILRRSEREILHAARFDLAYVQHGRDIVNRYGAYLETVEPVTFLYDLNIRNVIIHQEAVAGVIDVDEVWYGDPLLPIGRGKALLLAMGQKSDYIDYWCRYLDLSDLRLKIVDLYALLYCIRFMGTSGLELNGNYSIQTDVSNAQRLETVTQQLLHSLSAYRHSKMII